MEDSHATAHKLALLSLSVTAAAQVHFKSSATPYDTVHHSAVPGGLELGGDMLPAQPCDSVSQLWYDNHSKSRLQGLE